MPSPAQDFNRAAADEKHLEELAAATRKMLAWRSIMRDAETLGLTGFQLKQAQAGEAREDKAVQDRIRETWGWLLDPLQPDPRGAIEWEETQLTGNDPVAVRAGKRLIAAERLITGFGPKRLVAALGKVGWDGKDHLPLAQVWDWFAQ